MSSKFLIYFDRYIDPEVDFRESVELTTGLKYYPHPKDVLFQPPIV